SDEAAGLIGGLGLAPSLNVGDHFAMAQAAHGSAPDLAGRGVANPCALILSSALLLDWLGHRHRDPTALAASAAIQRAVATTLAEGRNLTPDLGGDGTTRSLGLTIMEHLAQPHGS
ncbi:MAG: isocitrate/isopropylmalate dehydrogenase family protein, partial [Armatimonadetes bacterium]|nr:isocitrate/isopropylmalate dehydrogenase family protein [Armatimonadota bacterium]